jgi:trehalose 6-phosphate synthase/phosphatase
MEKLIIVSNRLPFRIDKKGNEYEVKQSSGGLVSALQSVSSSEYSITWTGIADFRKDVWNNLKYSLKTSRYKLEPIFVDKKKYYNYYNGFSNAMLWPLFHYFPSYAEYKEESFEAYKDINQEFAQKIIGMAPVGAIVWIHDYHLLLLPGLIKLIRPDLKVGFFLHIPFPSYEIFKLIPAVWRSEILESLMCSDVLGFHTEEYLGHFRKSLSYFKNIWVNNDTAINGHDHAALTKVYPISIDFNKFHNAWSNPGVVRGRKNIKKMHPNLRIIFSVDRLDYTKGVINRLMAYENLLSNYPEYREKVVFVINVVPSRDQMVKYIERKKMIEENIGRINGLYGSVNWQPVIYQYRHLTFNQLLSFYTVADLALITPLRDGMNLVAKEFVASRKDRKGVLILSEFAGAATELKQAILVNPNDIRTLTDGIIEGLSLSDTEQQHRMEVMQQLIKDQDIHKWTNSILNDIKEASTMNYESAPHLMTFTEKIELFDSYQKTKKRLILLDYDGTLVPHQHKPEDAEPGNKLKELLTELNSQPENEVVIVSGRDTSTLENWLSDTGVSFVAEHGALYKGPDLPWESFVTGASPWRTSVENIFEKATCSCSGAFIERKKHSIALHYRGVDTKRAEELKVYAQKELLMCSERYDFNVLNGNMVIEVRNCNIDKGMAVMKLVNSGQYDFVLALGDDTTDEDMFSALSETNNCFTVKVGIESTKAKCNLINVNNVISLLDQLNKYKSVPNIPPVRYNLNSN